MNRTALYLELLSGLRGKLSTLSLGEWWLVMSAIDAASARVIVLRVLHDMTFDEIAERLEVPTNDVFYRWNKTRRRMKTMNRELEMLIP